MMTCAAIGGRLKTEPLHALASVKCAALIQP